MNDGDVNARMHSHGQPKPASFDQIEQSIKFGCLVTNDMENRTEYLSFQIADNDNFENVRRDIKPAGRPWRRYLAREVDNRRASHQCDMRIKVCLGATIDYRANLDLRIARIADQEFACRPGDHRDHLVRDVVLDAKKPKRGAALPSRAKRRGENIVANLFRQGRRIDDHRVDPASLRDQRWNWPVLRGQPAIDLCGGFHRARKSHPRDSGQGDKLLAKLAVPRQEMQCGARHAGPVEKLDGGGGAQGGLLGGFSEDAVSSGKRRGYLAEKDR